MKKLLIALGILMLLPSGAYAAEPLSPFVKAALSRADAALNYAESLPPTSNCSLDQMQEAEENAALRRAVDPDLTSILAADSLLTMTVCQRYDAYLLEQKMNEVRSAMHSAIANNACQLQTISALAFFSNDLERLYRSVVEGGLDPSYTDFSTRSKPTFGDADEEAPVCPFTTDYAVPSVGQGDGGIKSYGCDAHLLEFITEQADVPETLRMEAEQESTTTEALLSRARETAGTIRQFQETVLTLLARVRGKPPPSFPPITAGTDMEHASIVGCKANGESPYKVETWNRSELPQGVLLASTYDAFSLEENTTLLMRLYLHVRQTFARTHALPQSLVSSILAQPIYVYPLAPVVEDLLIMHYQDAASDHARASALYLATDTDALGQMMTAMQPLRHAVQSFGFIASFPSEEAMQCKKEETRPQRMECCHYVCKDKEGESASCERLCNSDTPLLPSYVRDMALFLRRSCVDGSCKILLDSVLNRSVNPACYPYGSGCYQRDDYTPDACFKSTDGSAPFDCYPQSSSTGA